jgi:hypothetical protein
MVQAYARGKTATAPSDGLFGKGEKASGKGNIIITLSRGDLFNIGEELWEPTGCRVQKLA